ncbi:MAG: Uma2 family endonuclease [Caldilineaceae bacterium]
MATAVVTAAKDTTLSGQNGWPMSGQWRYADYLKLPDDGRRYEIIEGVLYVANAPSFDHQYVVSKILFYLQLFTIEHDLGVVVTAPFEVHLSETSKPVQPDVLFVRKERQPQSGAQVFAGAPDLIVEVISPSSLRLDRKTKYDAYEQAGVAEYWLVDPKVRAVEIYTLTKGEYALVGQYTNDELLESNVLPGLQIKASALFQPLA